MKRRLMIALLALGMVGGFASFLCRAEHGAHGWGRRAQFERRVAELCTDAALRAQKR
jgi:hypothetical protein